MAGHVLDNADEVLFRQVHPKLIDNGLPASPTFLPSREDNGKLSVDRSSLVEAAEAMRRYQQRGLNSAAVYGLSVGEFGGEDVECHADPIIGNDTVEANDAHALADFTKHSGNKRRNMAKRLKGKALERGQLYP